MELATEQLAADRDAALSRAALLEGRVASLEASIEALEQEVRGIYKKKSQPPDETLDAVREGLKRCSCGELLWCTCAGLLSFSHGTSASRDKPHT